MAVLVVHASLGAGHKRAAQALHEVLTERGIASECRDLLDFLPTPLSRFYSNAYMAMVTRARGLWSLLYKTADKLQTPYAPARSRLESWQFRHFKQYLIDNRFDLILSTHFASSALVADWREEIGISGKTVSVITDYVAHRCWKRAGLDHYFVPCFDVAEELIRAGIAAERIAVSGIPISQAFSDLPDREQARKEHQCEPDRFLVLVLCSGVGTKQSIELLEEVRKAHPRLRILVSAGSDAKKEQQIRTAFQNDSCFEIFGFSPHIAKMMCAADLLISKPGGLSVSEALAVGLPQILLPPIPGQEEGNARYSSSQGAAVCVQNKKGMLRETLGHLVQNPQRLQYMAECAKKIGKRSAAHMILDTVLV